MKKKLRLYKNLIILVNLLGIIFLGLMICNKLSIPKEIIEIPSTKKVLITASKNKDDYKQETSLSLIMVGDSLIHSAVYEDAKTSTGYDFKPMLANVKDHIQSFDLAFYNQESILAGEKLGLSTYPSFNSPYEVGDAFIDAGFNLVSLANNHTLDRGEQAIINSKTYWKKHPDILTAGSYQNKEEKDTLQIREMKGITYTLLSYTDTTNGLTTKKGKEYLVNRYSKELVKNDIEKVRDKVDLLLVSIHFGQEYTHTPNSRQKEIANYLSQLGVDIIIGHHPHVVQPIEFIDDTMVIYSLGNFLSAQRGIERLTGLMASVDIKKTTYQGKSEIILENPTAELIYTYSNINGKNRSNFNLYRYKDLTEQILPNYKEYQKEFLSKVTQDNPNIETR